MYHFYIYYLLGKIETRHYVKNPNITSGFLNSVFYVVAGTALNILFTSVIAYVLSRRNLLWKNPMMFMVILTMIFTRSLIPFYLLVRGLGLRNTRLALLLPDLVIVCDPY